VALVVELLVLVRDHIEQHGEQRLVAGGLVGSEVAGADEDIAGIGLPSRPRGSIVLAIREQQVDTDRGRAGDAWPELHLLLEIGEGALTGELARAARPAACGTGEAEREAGCRAPEAALSDGHRVVMSCRDLDFGI